MALLEVNDLSIGVRAGGALRPVVRGVSFAVGRGATLGVVGESGCGKSLTALAIMGLLDDATAQISGGQIHFNGQDLTRLDAAARRAVMGTGMAMIFQEPMTSLNPVYRVGDQITEALHQHYRLSKPAARDRAVALLSQVRIPDPEQRARQYPHQLSGGMRQRVMIAIALAGDPKLLIADEPTTALDVTVQAQILALLVDLQRRTDMAVVLISHDLGVIAETCAEVAVMYRGEIVEAAPAGRLFAAPCHPYSRGLLRSLPDADAELERLPAIPGRVPAIDETVAGCAFHPRCERAETVCAEQAPAETQPVAERSVRCHFPFTDTP